MNKHIVTVLGADIPVLFNHRELSDALAVELKKHFGDIVEVEFINVLDKEVEKYLHMWPFVLRSRLPLILVNGELHFDGSFSKNEIMNALATMIKPVRPPVPSAVPPVRAIIPMVK
ncbi:MAG: hypothetical protein H0Z40_07695 [Desulfotomaculum sp.]|nr:hypothetical protein [Desulfotomaculum sp.]